MKRRTDSLRYLNIKGGRSWLLEPKETKKEQRNTETKGRVWVTEAKREAFQGKEINRSNAGVNWVRAKPKIF